jgi:hypothetical protein
MEKAIENICIEFSDSYLTSRTDYEDIISLKLSIMDIQDLRAILKHYGFRLESISILGYRKALAIFSKTHVSA